MSYVDKTRRRFLTGLGAVTGFGLAGCSGDDGGNGDSGGVDVPVTNDLTGFEVIDASGEAMEDSYEVEITIENTGDQTADKLEHDFSAILFDSEDNELGETNSWQSMSPDPGPGETATITMTASSVDPQAVDSYEIVLTCDGFDDGVYCPENS